MDKPVVVTGAHGFIGRHVARKLASLGHTVIGLGHGVWTRDEWRSWGISEWHTVDVTLENLVTYAGRPQAIVHCAGSGSVVYSASHPHQDYQRTVATTAAVLEFARLHAPEAAVVCPSSAAVYGQARQIPISETAALNPISPYGVHKLMAEMHCRIRLIEAGGRPRTIPFDEIVRISLQSSPRGGNLNGANPCFHSAGRNVRHITRPLRGSRR